MDKTLGCQLIAVFITVILQSIQCSDIGTISCTNGAWIPDPKLIGFGLGCPLPLDGKAKSKGKTMVCVFKKINVYDGKTVKKDSIAKELCPAFKQPEFNKGCKQAIQKCLKNSKGYFKAPDTDVEYKSWSPAYECVYKWVTDACTKKS